jgi:UDP-N-acetylmuramate dehydrogenase
MSDGVTWRTDVPVGPLTTYRVGGAARWFVTAQRVDDLLDVARRLEGRAVLVVGKGSNLLVSDAGFDGLVVQLGEGFAGVEVLDGADGPSGGGADGPPGETADDTAIVRAGGAAFLPVVARRTVALGLTGFEWAVGVPGSIGGAVRMNAGGHGSEIAQTLVGVRVVDLRTGEDVTVPASELALGYRTSNVRDEQVVVHADLRLRRGDVAAGEAELSEIVRWRREHQPGGQNAGSVFTNPEGDSAGRLIDAAGCRGLRIGTAQVSTKHANFIQADPGGSADDVFELMVAVARRVREVHGVVLHPETRMVGFPPFDEAIGASA